MRRASVNFRDCAGSIHPAAASFSARPAGAREKAVFKRHCDAVQRAEFKRAQFGRRVIRADERDEQRDGGRRMLLELAQQFKPVRFGRFQIHQHQIRRMAFEEIAAPLRRARARRSAMLSAIQKDGRQPPPWTLPTKKFVTPLAYCKKPFFLFPQPEKKKFFKNPKTILKKKKSRKKKKKPAIFLKKTPPQKNTAPKTPGGNRRRPTASCCWRALLDDKFASLYRAGKIHGGVFLGRGQEALSVARRRFAQRRYLCAADPRRGRPAGLWRTRD